MILFTWTTKPKTSHHGLWSTSQELSFFIHYPTPHKKNSNVIAFDTGFTLKQHRDKVKFVEKTRQNALWALTNPSFAQKLAKLKYNFTFFHRRTLSFGSFSLKT